MRRRSYPGQRETRDSSDAPPREGKAKLTESAVEVKMQFGYSLATNIPSTVAMGIPLPHGMRRRTLRHQANLANLPNLGNLWN